MLDAFPNHLDIFPWAKVEVHTGSRHTTQNSRRFQDVPPEREKISTINKINVLIAYICNFFIQSRIYLIKLIWNA